MGDLELRLVQLEEAVGRIEKAVEQLARRLAELLEKGD